MHLCILNICLWEYFYAKFRWSEPFKTQAIDLCKRYWNWNGKLLFNAQTTTQAKLNYIGKRTDNDDKRMCCGHQRVNTCMNEWMDKVCFECVCMFAVHRIYNKENIERCIESNETLKARRRTVPKFHFEIKIRYSEKEK